MPANCNPTFDITDAGGNAGINFIRPYPNIAQALDQFAGVYVVDFEYIASEGAVPQVVCCVVLELKSGSCFRYWRDDLIAMEQAPWNCGVDAVTVAYYASADMGCFAALGWAMPENILDPYCEFKTDTNGLLLEVPHSLLGALAYYGLSGMSSFKKEAMRDLVMSGGPWTSDERAVILDYCAEDVFATASLLEAMAPKFLCNPLRIGHAIWRGRYMASVATMEHNGIPIDVPVLEKLVAAWPSMHDSLIRKIDHEFGVYEGHSFRTARFAEYLRRHKIPWPTHSSGELKLDDDTFRQMAKAYPQISPLRELRHALSEMRRISLTIGPDGRNRVNIRPFASRTGRNQPSTSKYIFGSATWLRGLLKAQEGFALAYLDFSSQEIAIAAVLSNDQAMQRAYLSGDPYMQFAIDAGLAPADATKKTHGQIRSRCKAIVLGVGYGMGPETLAQNAGISVIEARQLLQLHKETYRDFWSWANLTVDRALCGAELTTTFGWRYRLDRHQTPNPRSLQNWPMQANGAEMLRLACIKILKSGVRLCCPVHDAVLIEAPLHLIDEHVEIARQAMIWASGVVLAGFECRVDAEVFRHPERFMDPDRGSVMWNAVMDLIGEPQWSPNSDD